MGRTIRRILSVIPAVAVQVLVLLVLIKWLSPYAAVINFILSIFSIVFVLYIMIAREEAAYKTLWLLLILPFHWRARRCIFSSATSARRIRWKGGWKRRGRRKAAGQRRDVRAARRKRRGCRRPLPMSTKTGCPILANEGAKYYPLGDMMFPDMLEDLKAAEKTIYAEYFIIQHGEMFDAMLDIMRQKAAQGVDVRVIYDDLGSISTFSTRDRRELIESGIRCVAFNPMLAVGGTLNYRDHKKMLIIDGKTALHRRDKPRR